MSDDLVLQFNSATHFRILDGVPYAIWSYALSFPPSAIEAAYVARTLISRRGGRFRRPSRARVFASREYQGSR
jgi:hypothetical protein